MSHCAQIKTITEKQSTFRYTKTNTCSSVTYAMHTLRRGLTRCPLRPSLPLSITGSGLGRLHPRSLIIADIYRSKTVRLNIRLLEKVVWMY